MTATPKAPPDTDPQRWGSGRGKFVPQTLTGGANISAPLCLRPAGAIGVFDTLRSSRRTDRPQPNTHKQEQQLNKPQKSLSPNPKGIIQENNILYNSGNPNYSCRRKQDGTYKICFLYNSVIPLTVRVPWGLLTTPHLPNFLIYRNAHTG